MISTAPISRDLGLQYHDIDFDAKLMGGSIYRDNASTEADKAWDDLGISCKKALPLIYREIN